MEGKWSVKEKEGKEEGKGKNEGTMKMRQNWSEEKLFSSLM